MFPCSCHQSNCPMCTIPLHPSTQESFIAQLEIIVRKKATIKVSIEEMWVSEQEMRDDLRWKP